MATPCAARNVLAIAPPIKSTSTFSSRLPIKSSFVEIFAPPIKAPTGSVRIFERGGKCAEFRLHQATAKEGRWRATPSVEAWARCAAEKASLT